MCNPLDIFKTDSDGGVLWLGAAASFVAAKERVEKLARSSPGEYLILNQITGDKVRVLGGISAPATSPGVMTAAA